MNKTLMTDFYELTMAQTYFNEGKQDEILTFDIFFRNNPLKNQIPFPRILRKIPRVLRLTVRKTNNIFSARFYPLPPFLVFKRERSQSRFP